MKNQAFTMPELLVVIAIIGILAAASIDGTGAVLRSVKFSKAFNKIVFMTQRARNMALNPPPASGEAAPYYRIKFTGGIEGTAKIFAGDENNELEDSAPFALIATDRLELYALSSDGTACAEAEMKFMAGDAKSELACTSDSTSTSTSTKLLTIGLCERTDPNTSCVPDLNAPRKKIFFIHKAAGIVQVP